MEKVYKYRIAILFLIVLFASCKKDWFDIKSQNNLVVPSTLKDLQGLLDKYELMNGVDVSLGEAASDGHYVTDMNYNQFDQNSKNSYTWSQEQPYQEVADWAAQFGPTSYFGAYPRIYNCNLVLDGLIKIKEQSATFNNVKGQALFQRARTFYQLAEVFAPPYIPGQSDNELGVPLRLEADINLPSKRTTLKQTYDQIINDLLLAKDLLPDLPEFKTRGSKASAYALLARIYLSIEDYENAGKYADLSLQIYSTLMDYNSLDENAIQPIIEFNPECIFQASMYNQSIQQGIALIDADLFNSYSEKDRRKYIFFQLNLTENTIIYKGSYYGSVSTFSGVATDELYLIRAESYARAGKVNEAMRDLNTLLAKRYEPGFIDQTAIDKDDALRQILEERKKELLMRGLRWSDLRRLNRDDRFKITLTRVVNGETYTLEPDSYRYTFPIPYDIIQMNGLEQNKGW